MGVPDVPWQPRIMVHQLTLSQLRGADYAHQIIVAPPDFQPSYGPALTSKVKGYWFTFAVEVSCFTIRNEFTLLRFANSDSLPYHVLILPTFFWLFLNKFFALKSAKNYS